jgi:hypothetical protein
MVHSKYLTTKSPGPDLRIERFQQNLPAWVVPSWDETSLGRWVIGSSGPSWSSWWWWNEEELDIKYQPIKYQAFNFLNGYISNLVWHQPGFYIESSDFLTSNRYCPAMGWYVTSPDWSQNDPSHCQIAFGPMFWSFDLEKHSEMDEMDTGVTGNCLILFDFCWHGSHGSHGRWRHNFWFWHFLHTWCPILKPDPYPVTTSAATTYFPMSRPETRQDPKSCCIPYLS